MQLDEDLNMSSNVFLVLNVPLPPDNQFQYSNAHGEKQNEKKDRSSEPCGSEPRVEDSGH